MEPNFVPVDGTELKSLNNISIRFNSELRYKKSLYLTKKIMNKLNKPINYFT